MSGLPWEKVGSEPSEQSLGDLVTEPITLEFSSPLDSEDGLARRVAAEQQSTWRHVALWNKWLKYIDTHWAPDEVMEFPELVRMTIETVSNGVLDLTNGASKQLHSAKTVRGVEWLARSDSRLRASADQWDTNPWALNCENGYMELHDGELKVHSPEDYVTRIAGTTVGDANNCPLWRSFLKTTTGEDPDLESYLKRVAGYCLTGSVREHVFFFFFGRGANGKTTFTVTLQGVMGSYSQTASIETFCETNQERHPTDLAALRGARLIVASETRPGRRWDQSKITMLTGGDKIRARFMRCDEFEYAPQFKLIVHGNHKPSLRAVNEAIRRRIHLVPFRVTIPPVERDPDLFEKLKTEWPAILAWALEGSREWQRQGLAPPKAVLDATEEYLTSEDTAGRWIEERTVQAKRFSTQSSHLYRDYRGWAEEAGEHVRSQKVFSQELLERGFNIRHERTGQVVDGIALRSDFPSEV